MVRYSIASEIFSRYPGYVRGVVLAHAVTNGPSPQDLVGMLRAAEAAVDAQTSLAQVATHPRIRSWREAFRAFGAKPGEHRSSIEAMTRRALRGDPIPSINTLVDIGNVVSLEHLVPAGAHAIDHLVEDLSLRLATGREFFTPLGSDTVEHPEAGEVVFAQGDVILTRRWVWRQGLDTLVQMDTSAAEFNVDGLPPVTPDEVEAICLQIESLVERYCGGRTRHTLLSQQQPALDLMP